MNKYYVCFVLAFHKTALSLFAQAMNTKGNKLMTLTNDVETKGSTKERILHQTRYADHTGEDLALLQMNAAAVQTPRRRE
jgi:hypothetical protein